LLDRYDLRDFGWDAFFESSFENHAAQGLVAGRVAVQHRGAYVLFTQFGELWAELTGRMLHDRSSPAELPAVGDWVAARPRLDEGRASIAALLERRSKFSRNVAGFETDEQVLAANVDVVFLVASLNADLNPRRLERYLTMAWAGGAEPVIVLTKSDLCYDLAEPLSMVEPVAQGIPVHVTSSATGDGIDALRSYFAGARTVALLGSSGVGKSSLVNALAGADVQEVRPIRADETGRHTTTRRELVVLSGGGLILDTPGMRELQLWDDDGAIDSAFEDVSALAALCKFRDCKHEHEPGCAVTGAIRAGALSESRLRSYNKLQRELFALAIKKDKRAQSERRKEWRRTEKARRR